MNVSLFLPLHLLGRRDIVVTCVCLSVHLSVCNTFVRAIIFDRIELGSPNLTHGNAMDGVVYRCD